MTFVQTLKIFARCKSFLALSMLLIGAAGVSLPACAQNAKASISGTVVDNSGAVLQGAQVKVSPLNLTGVTNNQGIFTLPDVPAGAYTVAVSYIGFELQSLPVQVLSGQPLNLQIAMTVANASEEILVTAERPHGEAEAINQTRTADNILQVLPAEVIVSLPNANVADAIGRLPSVTLYRIEGEGVYIQVRGTEPRLTNVTVDGITLPAPEPTVRQVRLDVIPSDMVAAVELNKTLSASQDANGIAASVNLRTKEAEETPTVIVFGNGGYTPILNGRDSSSFGGTLGKRFLTGHKLGILGNIDEDYNGRGIDNIQPALDPLSTNAAPFYDSNTEREYRYYRTRYGYDGSVDYRFNDNNSLFAHGFYSDLKDWGDKWYYSPTSTGLTCGSATPGACANGSNVTTPSPTAASPSPKFYTSSKRPNASVGTLILGGRHAFTNSQFNWTVSASRSYEIDSAGNPKADFSWIGPAVNCNFVPATQYDKYHPHFGTCDTNGASPLLNPNNFIFKDITISSGKNTDLQLTGQASYAHYYTYNGHYGILEGGFKFSNAHQTQDSTEVVYDGWSTKAGSGTPTVAQLQSPFSNSDYYNGTYYGGNYGPVSDFNLVQAYTLANFAGFRDGQKTAADTYPNLFHTVEQITAGYLMNTIDFGRMHLQTGLRFENTRTLTNGYNLTYFGAYNPKTGTYNGNGGTSNADCPGNTAPTGLPATGQCYIYTNIEYDPTYLDALPSVQIRYGLTQNSNLRAVYARGVARPDPYQLVPYVTEDNTASPTTVAIGNPSLRPEHANNYDLLYEDFLRPLGLLQGGFFLKQLTAPQLQTVLPGSISLASFPAGYFSPAETQALQQYPGDTITQTVNGENAYLYGLELSFQQHFSYLPGPLRGLGLSANYSYTASKLKGLPLRTDSPTLIDQSPQAFNISPTYDTKRFSARVGLAYNGASLFTYNYTSPTFFPTSTSVDPSRLGPSGPSGDVYTLTHYQVDAQFSLRLYPGMSLVVSGLNLNNEVFGYYTGNTNFVNQREYYKPTYTGGIRYTLGKNR